MKPAIRIEAGLMGHNARVFYVADDGAETDISTCCRAVTVAVRVGEVTKASLEVFISEGSTFNAEVEDVVVHKIKRRRRRQRFLKVTGLGQQVDQWIRG